MEHRTLRGTSTKGRREKERLEVSEVGPVSFVLGSLTFPRELRSVSL